MSSKSWHEGQETISEVDILIVGGTGVGVGIALEAEKGGHSVYLTCSRPYLGEDICGEMLFWREAAEEGESELSQRIFSSDENPVRPMKVKMELEQSMVEKEIPFLLNTYPAGLVKNGSGNVCGVHFATRSGIKTILAKLVVDASCDGYLSRLNAGEKGENGLRGKQTVLHRTLCNGKGQDAEGIEVVERPSSFQGISAGEAYTLSARTYRLEVDFGKGTPREIARAESEIATRCWVPGEYIHQERLRLVPAKWAEQSAFELEELSAENAFISLGALTTTSGENGRKRMSPIAAIDLAVSLGKRIAQLSETFSRDFSVVSVIPETLPEIDQCDVLVLGGGTGGGPAAIAASRKGADTVIVEMMDQLGGVGTVGQISRYWFGNRVGFTHEIDTSVAALEIDEKLQKNIGQWTNSTKAYWLEKTAFDGGVSIYFRSLCAGVMVESGRAFGLFIATSGGFGTLKSKCIVDATGCADVAAAAGAPTREIGADHIAVQGTGLAGMRPGRDYHNSDHNFCDDTSVFDTTAFLVSSKLKFKDHFDAGQLVDSRERRQIIGKVTLGPSDFLSERRYEDTLCVASSNFDSHGFTIHPVFMIKAPHKRRLWADVPYRTFLPQDLERVIVIGLGVSAHRDAIPVIRMQADVQNHGYAAGYAAAFSALTDTDLAALPIKEIQKHLVEIDNLPERVLTDNETGTFDENTLKEAVENGWDDLKSLSIIFAAEKAAIPVLKKALENSGAGEAAVRYATILALLGDNSGENILFETLKAESWDEGWNYRGMGQFGFSLSGVDVRLIALSRVGSSASWEVVLEKIKSLPADPDLSHCRAVAEASENLYPRFRDNRIALELKHSLEKEGMHGHAQTTLKQAQALLSDDPDDNQLRNLALREIHLLRALYRCGDLDNYAKEKLEFYAQDLRAHFSRHAKAILAERI